MFASSLPLDTKKDLCYEVIFHDYSSLPPENFKDIRTFSDTLVSKAIAKYQKGLIKTKKAREALKREKPREQNIRKVTDIVHVDQKLEDITIRLRESAAGVQKAIRNDYYKKASKRSQGKFKTAVNHLVSGIEEILKNG